jgi:DNA polymerase III subunit alpha
MNAPIRNPDQPTSAPSSAEGAPPFVHLKVHSAYSLLEGALPIGTLAKLSARLGFPAVGLTDTNNLFGILEFSEKLAAAGIQPIVGVALTIDFEEQKPERSPSGLPPPRPGTGRDGMIALYAMNEAGYASLMKLVSRAHLCAGEAESPNIKLT